MSQIQNNHDKTALVLSGGGMRCAYAAGAAVALGRSLNFKEPDILVAASGSVGSAFYYLSGQYDYVEETWTEIIPDNPQFISLRRKQIMDIDYLIDDVFKKITPLDVEAFSRSKTAYFVPIRKKEDGSVCFISRVDTEDIYEIMRAAKAVPIVFNEEVKIYDDEYVDGFFGLTSSVLIAKAVREGAKKIISLDYGISSYPYEKLKHLYSLVLGKEWVHGLEQNILEAEQTEIPDDVEIITLSPSKKLHIGLLTNDRDKLEYAFYTGYHDVTYNDRVRDLLRKEQV